MDDEVVIIGGGFAGLSAGVALAQAGRRVRVVEQRRYLGGRARSFHYAPASSVVDNGQHLFMGCYHSTIQFLKTIGTLDRIHFQDRLQVHFVDRQGKQTLLSLPRFPAPWHLALGTIASTSFQLREKLQILRVGRAVHSINSMAGAGNLDDLTVEQWLTRLGQSERLRANFWDLLCIATLNESPRLAAARMLEPVLRMALFQSPEDSRLGFAGAGLSECYTAAAADFIQKNRGEVELERNAVALLISGDSIESAGACQGVRFSNGSVIYCRTVLSAVPPWAFVRLLPEALSRRHPYFAPFGGLRPAPIISINLWFDRPVTDLLFAGLRGTTIQWLFNKGLLLGTGQHYISLVISGAHEHICKENDQLVGLALVELEALFPKAARKARLTHSLVIKERWATFSPTVDSLRARPPARTPLDGLYLAGDWTQTGLPATIESAVKSGYAAASEILKTS